MIYVCADDYGICEQSDRRIEACLGSSVLNKISVMPNGYLTDLPQCVANGQTKLSLHLNLVEGYPLSPREEIPLLLTENGNFRYSFVVAVVFTG